MKIIIDASVLMLYLHPESSGPLDPATGASFHFSAQRVEDYIGRALKGGHLVVIPTPALAECLAQHDAAAAAALVARLERKSGIEIRDFCTLSAIEVGRHGKKDGYLVVDSTATKKYQRALVKHDLQILAIACVVGADEVLTDDKSLKRWVAAAGMKAKGVGDLQIPPQHAQMRLDS